MSWPEIQLLAFGGLAVPGGAAGQVQYNAGGFFAGDATFTFDSGTKALTVRRVLVGDGTVAQPSIGAADTAGYGFYFVGGIPYIALVGAEKFRFTTGTGGVPYLLMSGGSGTILSLGSDLPITNAAAATLQLGAANAASPVAQTLQSQGSRGGTDVDVAGANLTIRPGAGTGAATGSSLIFQTPAATGSGSGAQTQSTRLTLDNGNGAIFYILVRPDTGDARDIGTSTQAWRSAYISRATLGSKTKALTESSATGFVDIAVTAGQRISGEVIYEVYAADATDFQTITGRLRYAAVNKAGTTTVTVSEVGTQTTAVSTGTLTATNTAADTTNKITLSCNAVSSLTQTTLEIRYRIDSVSTNAITPL